MTAPSLLDDFYESEYPEHSRTSCSDEHPVNAEVSGHGCLRCNAIFFTRAGVAFAEIADLAKRLEVANALVEQWRIRADNMSASPSIAHLRSKAAGYRDCAGELEDAIDAATQEGEG